MCEGLSATKQDFPEVKLHPVSPSEKGIGFSGIECMHWNQLPKSKPPAEREPRPIPSAKISK